MDQWEYQILIVDMAKSMRGINHMWEIRGSDGLTDWDRLQNMGRDGWELVSQVPIIGQFGLAPTSVTTQIIFTFKRKLQPQPTQEPSAPQP
jgi:hypothetical protein